LSSELTSALSKVRRRLVPFLFLLYIVAYLDRINVGFAALQMNRALGFSDTVYAMGAGVFFLSYTAFEIPSNVILARVGARLWIARIMLTWGLVSSATMFVRSAGGFYALRFLLGAAEAGFFPGIIYYMTQWIPGGDRARTVAAFMTAVLAAGIIGGPVSGAILGLSGAGGLAGWQWLFLLEGLPALALAAVVWLKLDDRPEQAGWLTPDERAALVARLRQDDAVRPRQVETTKAALRNPTLWRLAAVYFTVPVALYAIGFFLPQMIQNAGSGGVPPGTFTIGVLTAIPYLVGGVGMVVVGRHSDVTGERRWHVAFSAIGGGLAFAFAGAAGRLFGLSGAIAAISLATLGLAAMFGPFWSLATSFTAGTGAAAGIALINSVGNIGGFVGPSVVGYLRDLTSSFTLGFVFIGAVLALGGLVVLTVQSSAGPEPRGQSREPGAGSL
jgi:MFS transporter, ACS family, tartrate transporter